MLRRIASSCVPVVVCVAVLGSVAAQAVPAAASGTTGVTIFLKAPNPAGLRRLAAAHGLSHAARIAALDKLLPSRAQHAAVRQALRRAGLTVGKETAWSISATGSTSDVDAAFGAHPAMRAHATPAQRRAAVGPYPTMPGALRGLATAAFASSGGPPLFHAADVNGFLTGDDFRNAYTSTDMTAHGQSPYSGSDPNATLTIATIQFAGWNSSDLTTWANTSGLGVPGYSAAKDLTMIPVDEPAVPAPDASDTGDEEVDLDQEAILSTDPYAHQRAYFAPNGGAGLYDTLAQVLDDVAQDRYAYKGGDPRIVALSSSWGVCEADTGVRAIEAIEPVLTSIVAAGVTIFASSGDDGVYDVCKTHAGGGNVSYPASSPAVVGVGGTSLSPSGSSAPNNGTNWVESAWSCTTKANCDPSQPDLGGSGGGVSGFAKPSYQDAIANAPFAQSNARMVPDVSAEADPKTGFPIYTSDPTDNPNNDSSGYLPFGGTSLAAPVSAALFTDALAANGVTAGVGDIHTALYTAYAENNGSFRDITAGSNGAAADAPADPSVNAGPGYDTVTGLGAPLWPKIVARQLNPLPAPTATAAIALTQPHSASSPNQVGATWTGAAASGGLDVQRATVRISRVGHSGTVYSNSDAPADGTHTFTAVPGSTYKLTVTARDQAAEPSSTQTATVVVPIDDSSFNFSGAWHRVAGSADVAGSLQQTRRHNASASVAGTGKVYSLLAQVGPAYGKLAVFKGRAEVGVINLRSNTIASRRITIYSVGSVARRTFTFVCLGHGPVDVDGLYVAS